MEDRKRPSSNIQEQTSDLKIEIRTDAAKSFFRMQTAINKGENTETNQGNRQEQEHSQVEALPSTPSKNKSGKKSNVRFDDATIQKDEGRDKGGQGQNQISGFGLPTKDQTAQNGNPVSFFLRNTENTQTSPDSQNNQKSTSSNLGFFNTGVQSAPTNTATGTTGGMFITASQLIKSTTTLPPTTTNPAPPEPQNPSTSQFFPRPSNPLNPSPSGPTPTPPPTSTTTNLQLNHSKDQQVTKSALGQQPINARQSANNYKMSVMLPAKLMQMADSSIFKANIMPALMITDSMIIDVKSSSDKVVSRAGNTLNHKIKVADAAVHGFKMCQREDFRERVKELDRRRVQLGCVLEKVRGLFVKERNDIDKGDRENQATKTIERNRQLFSRMLDRTSILKDFLAFLIRLKDRIKKVADEEIARKESINLAKKERSQNQENQSINFFKRANSTSTSILFGSQQYNILSSKQPLMTPTTSSTAILSSIPAPVTKISSFVAYPHVATPSIQDRQSSITGIFHKSIKNVELTRIECRSMTDNLSIDDLTDDRRSMIMMIWLK